MLWLCVHLPSLPLEVFSRGAGEHGSPGTARDGAVAVVEKDGTRERVLVCNRAARAAGVRSGMRVAAAHALAPGLRLHARRRAAEARALARLAAWCGQFSDYVSLRTPDAVLLEVQASLKLFGGLGTISLALEHGIGELGYAAGFGVAPTPLAACLLARSGGGTLERGELRHVLGKLPLEHLELPCAALASLRGMGVETLAGCLRLPREGLARRLGPEVVSYLDRLLGRSADPLPRFEPPARYAARIALAGEAASTQALVFPLRRLVLELCGILAARAAGVQTLIVELGHERRPLTGVRIGLATPSRDPAHLLMLVREQLDQLRLDAPVVEVGLRVERLPALAALTGDLFGQNQPPPGEQLLDRLRLRLGEAAVDGLDCHPEHRPERAWRVAEPGRAAQTGKGPGGAFAAKPERPLWLLPRPRPLQQRHGYPCHEGAALSLLDGPERIESGWWDGQDVARDYFVAADDSGARYWVFQELRGEREWFLHGIFS